MKATELKKLAEEFSEFISESGSSTDVDAVMAEFWIAKFAVSNQQREAELLEFWMKS